MASEPESKQAKQPTVDAAPVSSTPIPADPQAELARVASNASSSSASTSSSSSSDRIEGDGSNVDLEAQRSKSKSYRSRVGSMASAMTERDIWGDMTEQERTLSRLETIQTLKTIYTKATENAGELDAPNDASEFKDIDPELVTWDGPDDPENPRNWPNSKKWQTTLVVSLYTFVTPFASSIVAPAIPTIAVKFHITNATIASLIVSVFVLGFAFGPLFLAPMSEMFGRTIVMHAAMAVFFVFNIACAVAQNTGQLIGFRFLAGLAGSAPLALGAGVLADVWTPVELAKALALFSLGPLLGPVVAPIIAGFIVENTDWRWVMWVLVIVSGVTSVLGLILFRNETYAPAVLGKRAERLRKETGNEHLHTVFEISRDFRRVFTLALERPFKLLVFNQALLGLGLFMAFTYGFLYLLFTTFPVLFKSVYKFNAGIQGLTYLAPGVGFLLGLGIFTPIGQKIFLRLTAANEGVSEPEYRLPVMFFGGILIPVGLFWYGWSAEKHIHWIMPLIGTAFFGSGLISVFAGVQSYLIDMSPRYAASAVSAGTVFRSLFGFVFPLFGRQMYDKLGYGWGNSMLGFIAFIIGIPFPLLIFRYGAKLRAAAERRMIDSEKTKEQREADAAAAAAAAASASTSTPPKEESEAEQLHSEKA